MTPSRDADDRPPGPARADDGGGRAARLALGLVQAAGSGGSVVSAARALLEVVHGDPAVCACALDLVEPVPDGVRTAYSIGYRPATLAYLGSPTFLERDPGYRLLCEHPDRPTRTWRDVEGYEASVSVVRVFRPSGYTGGATTRLLTAGGRHVANLHLSTAGGRDPDVTLIAALDLAGATLASLVDRGRSAAAVADEVAPGAAAAVVTDEGEVLVVPGRPVPHPDVLGAVRTLLAGAGAPNAAYRTVVGTRPHAVRLVAVRTGWLVLVEAGEPPHGLSARELEVLTLLADGHTNRGAARRLGITERTVAHHVEHIMVKLSTTSRAGAAARAAGEGLLLLPRAQPSSGRASSGAGSAKRSSTLRVRRETSLS